jgi:thiol-disulfide isomerase/thioredoxin
MKQKAVIALLSAVAVLVLAVSCPARSLMLRDLEGKRVYVDSLLAKGPLVMNFWATWCRPCRTEMPHLEKIYKELGPEGAQFATISVDNRRSKKAVTSYLEKYEITIPAYRDPWATLARKFQVAAIPTTVVLDRDGEIYHLSKGYRPGDEIVLKKKIEALLEAPVKGEAVEAEANN